MLTKLNERLKMNNEKKINSQNSQLSVNWMNEYVHTFKTLNQENPTIINEEHRKATIDDKYKFKTIKESPSKNLSKFMLLRKKKYDNADKSRNNMKIEGRLNYVQSLNNLQSRKYQAQEESDFKNIEYPDVHKRLARKIHEQWQMKRLQNPE